MARGGRGSLTPSRAAVLAAALAKPEDKWTQARERAEVTRGFESAVPMAKESDTGPITGWKGRQHKPTDSNPRGLPPAQRETIAGSLSSRVVPLATGLKETNAT